MLVVGASGVVGRAAFEHFARSAGWEAIGVSRRPPDLALGTHRPLDLRDREACREAIAALPPVDHVVYAALQERPGLVAGWLDRELMETNRRMLEHLLDALAEQGGALRHVSLLQGTKAYGAHLGRMRVPGREREARHDHANFYWLQEDLLRERAAREGFDFTIWRPPVVYGHAVGSPMNPLAALATYAAVCREEGIGLAWPGGRTGPVDGVDARLLARAFEWATETEAARGRVFNVTNGDVFVWENVWARLADAFGLAPGEPSPQRLAETMPAKAGLWQEIVRRHGLRSPGLMELVGDSFVYLDLHLGYGREAAAPATLLSTIELRQAGFGECLDSEDMLVDWIAWMQRERLIPPAPDRRVARVGSRGVQLEAP
ncbi:MAG: SDR family oxidoreductase [Myxococcales bacterium]|nr:SDR family oxidoreductase [Myxococcales bacterium]